ncbi:hypothetical protein N9137_02125 [Pseudomonadales bacterium]|nr:hypothetical protein [Pseudomonadales bacterium]
MNNNDNELVPVSNNTLKKLVAIVGAIYVKGNQPEIAAKMAEVLRSICDDE